MLCDSHGRNETCEMLVYMPAKTCDAFRDGGGPPKKTDPNGEERRLRGNLRRLRGYPDIIGPCCLEILD